MSNEELQKYIKSARKEYIKIRYAQCPAFDGEKVYFTAKGFDHLIRKGHEIRTVQQQIRRINLLPYVHEIIKNSNIFSNYRKIEKMITTKKGERLSTAHFWAFEKIINNRTVRVIICQINKEPKNFLSVMDRIKS